MPDLDYKFDAALLLIMLDLIIAGRWSGSAKGAQGALLRGGSGARASVRKKEERRARARAQSSVRGGWKSGRKGGQP